MNGDIAYFIWVYFYFENDGMVNCQNMQHIHTIRNTDLCNALYVMQL